MDGKYEKPSCAKNVLGDKYAQTEIDVPCLTADQNIIPFHHASFPVNLRLSVRSADTPQLCNAQDSNRQQKVSSTRLEAISDGALSAQSDAWIVDGKAPTQRFNPLLPTHLPIEGVVVHVGSPEVGISTHTPSRLTFTQGRFLFRYPSPPNPEHQYTCIPPDCDPFRFRLYVLLGLRRCCSLILGTLHVKYTSD